MRWARAICSALTKRPEQSAVAPAREQRGRVGHGADDGQVAAGRVLDGARPHRGGEREQQLGRRQRGEDFGDERRDLGRLYAEQDDVCLAGGGEVVGADIDAELRGERQRAVGMLHGRDELVWEQKIVLEKGLQQNAAHLARAQDGDAQVGEYRRGDWKFVGVSAHSHQATRVGIACAGGNPCREGNAGGGCDAQTIRMLNAGAKTQAGCRNGKISLGPLFMCDKGFQSARMRHRILLGIVLADSMEVCDAEASVRSPLADVSSSPVAGAGCSSCPGCTSRPDCACRSDCASAQAAPPDQAAPPARLRHRPAPQNNPVKPTAESQAHAKETYKHRLRHVPRRERQRQRRSCRRYGAEPQGPARPGVR